MDKTGRIAPPPTAAKSLDAEPEKPIRQQQWSLNSENNGRFVVEDKM